MSTAPKAATISIPETLALLDGEFEAFAQGVADARYAFWLGSGISLFRFPGLKDIVVKALDYLRGRADPADNSCRFKAGLERAFGIANLSDTEKASIDFSMPVHDWPLADLLRDRLSGRYAEFLNIDIDGEPLDLLVWEGVDVAATYADDTIDPDAEHYAIAVLIKEGLITELPSANWDGLVEKAVDELSGDGANGLKICVRSEDLQAPNQKATLIKFHGCAVRARDDEATYREYLVGAQRQIDDWGGTDSNTHGVAQYLINVAITKPTLLLGFSAQDANIRKVFGLAKAAQTWAWPGELPAYVMAENEIGEPQRTLLGSVYRNQFDGEDRSAIIASAHLKAFAKPLLTALILWTYAAKLQRTARLGNFELNDEFGQWVDAGITKLRDQLAARNNGDHLAFVRLLIRGLSRTKRLFLAGRSDLGTSRYEPLSQVPVGQMNQDVETETNGSPEAALVAATLANGVDAGDWSLDPPLTDDDRAGTALLTKGARTDRIFILGKPEAELALYASEAVLEEDEDAVLIHARPMHEKMQRSPSRAPGRTGAVGPRRLSMASLIAEAGTPADLMDGFKQEASL